MWKHFLKSFVLKYIHTINFNRPSPIYFGDYILRQFTMVIKYSEHFVVVMQCLEVLPV